MSYTNLELRRFLKKTNFHMLNYVSPIDYLDNTDFIKNIDLSKNLYPYRYSIQNITGLKYNLKEEQKGSDKIFSIKFSTTFYFEDPNYKNDKISSENTNFFFGNTYETQKIPIIIDENGGIIISDTKEMANIQMFFFNNESLDFNVCTEIILVSSSKEEVSIEETEEILGRTIIKGSGSSVSPGQKTTNILKGSNRQLLYKDMATKISDQEQISGATLDYCYCSNDLSHLNLIDLQQLLPCFYIFGNNGNMNYDIPGLLFRFFPKNIIESDIRIQVSKFDTIYLKNIEIAFHNLSLIDNIIINDFKNNYLENSTSQPMFDIKNFKFNERYLTCFIHNTYRNVGDISKKIYLKQRENHLIAEGVIPIDNFFVDEFSLCGLVCELCFSLRIDNTTLNSTSIPETKPTTLVIEYPVAMGIIFPNMNSLNNSTNIFEYCQMYCSPLNRLSDQKPLMDVGTFNSITMTYAISKVKEEIIENARDKEIENLTKRQNLGDPTSEEYLKQKKLEYEQIYDRKPAIEENKNVPQQPLIQQQNNFDMNQGGQFMIDVQKSQSQFKEEANLQPDRVENKDLLGNNLLIEQSMNYQNNQSMMTNNQLNNSQLQKSMNGMNLGMPMPINVPIIPQNEKDKSGKQLQQYSIPIYLGQNYYQEFNQYKQGQINSSNEYLLNQYLNRPNPYYGTSMVIGKVPTDSKYGKIVYEPEIAKNMTQDEINQLIAQGVLMLPDDEKNKKAQLLAEKEIEMASSNLSLLEYTYKQFLDHEFFGDIFTFQFHCLKPPSNLESYKAIPDTIYFKFSFWDFEEFTTEPATVGKPIDNGQVLPSSAPMLIYKKGEGVDNLSEREMKVKITYDPSIDNYTEYKYFVNYLLLRDVYIQIIDYDKQMNYGYMKIPLRRLIRENKKNLFDTLTVDIFDNYTFEVKGAMEMILKSDEIRTIQNFNIKEQEYKFRIFTSSDDLNPDLIQNYGKEPVANNPEEVNKLKENKGNFSLHKKGYITNEERMRKKKKIIVTPLDHRKLTEKEKEILAKKITEDNKLMNKTKSSTNNISNVLGSSNNENIKKHRMDQETEKRARVMRYLDQKMAKEKNQNAKGNAETKENRNNIDNALKGGNKNSQFYELLNYAKQIKSLNKEKVLEKAIKDSNKNELSLALIQGQPHYFNYILTNETPLPQYYQIVIGSLSGQSELNNIPSEPNENEEKQSYLPANSQNSKYEKVSLITDPEEYEYATMLYGMKIPKNGNYQCLDKEGHVTLEPRESIPLLIKCLSYKCTKGFDDNMKSKYSINVFDKKGIIQYSMTLNIFKVFPIIDFDFYYNIQEKKLSTLKILNPYKYNTAKTNLLLSYYHMINCGDDNILKANPQTNDFYLLFNNNLNPADNQIESLNNEEGNEEYNNNSENKRLLFFYLDKFKSQLFSTFQISINAYETIYVSANLGSHTKSILTLPLSKTSRSVKVYSSNEDVLFFPESYNDVIIVVPNLRYDLEYVLNPKKCQTYDIIIHCVDIVTKEIIKHWLIKLTANQSQIEQLIKINCKVGVPAQVKFQFTSPLNTWALLRFESSNKKLVQISQEQIGFNAGEMKFVNLNIGRMMEPCKVEAFVFITDNDEIFNKVIKVEITYYQN